MGLRAGRIDGGRRREHPRAMSARRLLIAVPILALLTGCGATTLRVDLAPTIDTDGKPGFESTLSIGAGMPLDYSGRSHHYVQALGSFGGGYAGTTAAGVLETAATVDYIYWAEPSMDVRVGSRFTYRTTPGNDTAPSLYGLGGHVALMPIVWGDDNSWMLVHFCLGPELRLERLWSDPSGGARGLFSAPLVAEFNLLAAGD